MWDRLYRASNEIVVFLTFPFSGKTMVLKNQSVNALTITFIFHKKTKVCVNKKYLCLPLVEKRNQSVHALTMTAKYHKK